MKVWRTFKKKHQYNYIIILYEVGSTAWTKVVNLLENTCMLHHQRGSVINKLIKKHFILEPILDIPIRQTLKIMTFMSDIHVHVYI